MGAAAIRITTQFWAWAVRRLPTSAACDRRRRICLEAPVWRRPSSVEIPQLARYGMKAVRCSVVPALRFLHAEVDEAGGGRGPYLPFGTADLTNGLRQPEMYLASRSLKSGSSALTTRALSRAALSGGLSTTKTCGEL